MGLQACRPRRINTHLGGADTRVLDYGADRKKPLNDIPRYINLQDTWQASRAVQTGCPHGFVFEVLKKPISVVKRGT
jgi:hypothetical protein